MTSPQLLLAAAILGAVGRPALAQAPANPERLLTPADVEQASGLKGVTRVAPNARPTATGDLNFGVANGQVALTIKFQAGGDFAHYRDAFTRAKQVAGVGEAALSPDANQIIFRQGRYTVVLTSGLSSDTMKWFLGLPQLTTLGKLLASRL